MNIDGQLPHERAILTEHRWWSLAEIEAAGDEIFTTRPRLVAGAAARRPHPEGADRGVE